jgi:hypothetical protein
MIVSERFSAGILTILRPYSRRILYVIEFLLSLVGLGFITFRIKTEWIILFAWSIAYFLAYTLLGVSRYPWYYAPLVPAFVVSIGLGLNALTQFSQHILQSASKYFFPSITLLVLATLGIGQSLHIRQLKEAPDRRREIYRAVGEWLAENTQVNDLVGTLEVGIIGYHSLRPMLDFAGLLQPEIGSRLGPDTSYADAALWATENYHPQYLVLQEDLYPSLEESYAAQYCLLIKQFPGENYGYPGRLNIFKCSSP